MDLKDQKEEDSKKQVKKDSKDNSEKDIKENLDLNKLSLSKKSNKSNSNKIKSSNQNSQDLNDMELEYEEDNYDIIEDDQEEILESMFLHAKNEVNENQINLYLDIINLDESKEKIWTYKCYEEICLIYLQFEQHLLFTENYKLLMKAGRTINPKSLRGYVENSVQVFLNEIIKHSKESINHWLEILTEDFNRFEQDKVINMFEANIRLKFLILSKEFKNNLLPNTVTIDSSITDYLSEKENLEKLANDYLIKECGCSPNYLDKKGNTFFYYSPPNSQRGGENYEIPIGWTAFGIEVVERYGAGNVDWLSNDGRPGEWAVAYHGFGCRMDPNSIKNIIKTIIHSNLKAGSGQAYQLAPDSRHKGNHCGVGVYVTPSLNVACGYAGLITLGGKKYRLVIMVRVNPSYIREPTTQKGFWIVDGDTNQLRPYRLLIKEQTNNLPY